MLLRDQPSTHCRDFRHRSSGVETPEAGSGDWRGERKNKRREAEAAEAAKGVSGASRIGRLSGLRDASEGGRGRERDGRSEAVENRISFTRLL